MDISKAASAYQQAGKMGGIVDKVNKATQGSDDATGGATTMGSDISNLVSEGLERARSGGYVAEATSTEALVGKTSIHELVSAVSNAELTLNTVVAVRDRMISAYQDIIKMPV